MEGTFETQPEVYKQEAGPVRTSAVFTWLVEEHHDIMSLFLIGFRQPDPMRKKGGGKEGSRVGDDSSLDCCTSRLWNTQKCDCVGVVNS